jgi:hypothetical protein
MTRIRSPFLAVALSFFLAACADGPAAPVDGPQFSMSAPIIITFEKQFTGDFEAGPWEWEGEAVVPGVGTVDLFSSIDLGQLSQSGQVLHAPILWALSRDDFELVVETYGIVNLATGSVRTNGRVASGPYTGATVHQQGQLTGLDAAGFIRIHPATAR